MLPGRRAAHHPAYAPVEKAIQVSGGKTSTLIKVTNGDAHLLNRLLVLVVVIFTQWLVFGDVSLLLENKAFISFHMDSGARGQHLPFSVWKYVRRGRPLKRPLV